MALADRPLLGWNSWNCFLTAEERADFTGLTVRLRLRLAGPGEDLRAFSRTVG